MFVKFKVFNYSFAFLLISHFSLLIYYIGLPENNAITILNAKLTKAKISTIAQAEVCDSFITFCKPIAARIQPQIWKKSIVPKSVANTGDDFPSIKKLGFA